MGLYKWDLLVILWDLGSGYVKMLLLKMAIEIVDSMVIFHSYVAVYQRVPGSNVAGRVYEIGIEWTYMKMALQFEGFCLCDQRSASARERCRLHGSIQPHPMFARMVSQQKYVLCSEWWGRASSVHACLCKGAATLASPRALLELEPSLVRSDLTSSHWEKPCQQKISMGFMVKHSIAWGSHLILCELYVVQLPISKSNSLLVAAAWRWRDMHSHSHTKVACQLLTPIQLCSGAKQWTHRAKLGVLTSLKNNGCTPVCWERLAVQIPGLSMISISI